MTPTPQTPRPPKLDADTTLDIKEYLESFLMYMKDWHTLQKDEKRPIKDREYPEFTGDLNKEADVTEYEIEYVAQIESIEDEATCNMRYLQQANEEQPGAVEYTVARYKELYDALLELQETTQEYDLDLVETFSRPEYLL